MYKILRNNDIVTYIMEHENLKSYFDTDRLQIEEIGDGNLNFVFRISSKDDLEKSLILKQAVPYLRCAGENYPLSKERMKFEIRALKLYQELAADLVPRLYHSDEDMSLVVMEDLKTCKILRKALIEKKRFDYFAEHISRFLADTLFFTSSLYLQSSEKRELMDNFNSNTELCKLTEDFVFTFPYMKHETNVIEEKNIALAHKLFSDYNFKIEVLELKYIFMNFSEALLHGDLHTGSIMVDQNRTKVIDPEFAFFGPIGFDIGALMANLFNSYISHKVLQTPVEYRNWILSVAKKIWNGFESRFLDLWRQHTESALLTQGFIPDIETEIYRKRFLEQILKHSCGFAGCKMARRVFGIAGTEEIRGIKDPNQRSKAQRIALRCGTSLVKSWKNIKNFEEIINIVEEI